MQYGKASRRHYPFFTVGQWELILMTGGADGPLSISLAMQAPLTGCCTRPQFLIAERGFNQFNRYTAVINNRHPVIIDRFIRSQNNCFTRNRLSKAVDLKRHIWNGFQ